MPVTVASVPAVVTVGRQANCYGVGEIVDFTATVTGAPPAMPPIWSWAVVQGSDMVMFSSQGNRARAIFVALASGTVAIRAKNLADNAEQVLPLTVVAPSNWSLGPMFNQYHAAGQAHAGFRACVQVQNNQNVSFDNLEMREGNAIPGRTGRYVTANVNNNHHHGATFPLAADWIRIGDSRTVAAIQAHAAAGHIGIAIDRVGSYGWAPPFNENGTFTWRIPWTYRLAIPVAARVDVNGTPVQVPERANRQANNVITHQETLTGNQMTMSKGGQTLTYTAAQAAVGTQAAWQNGPP